MLYNPSRRVKTDILGAVVTIFEVVSEALERSNDARCGEKTGPHVIWPKLSEYTRTRRSTTSICAAK
jgi:hypothetical protein